jgi:anhydro-N-acetylmuramic acid kinase
MPKAMVVAGVMSGTSADGVDVALVRIASGPKLEVLGHSEFRYAKAVREAVLRAASGEMKVAEVSRLHWKLGAVYADCVEKACAAADIEFGGVGPKSKPVLDLVGMHGQTIFHEAPRATWQIGEAAVVRERLGVPVVSDFRPADMAAGGQGAPLVPMLDYCMFRSNTKNRVLLNLGGIANMTAIPAGADLQDVIAFDSGPGNMVIDALMQRGYGKAFDRDGRVAARGRVIEAVCLGLLKDRYFRKAPPKSCGREQFGSQFAERLWAMCEGRAEDAVATATALTVRSVAEASRRFCAGRLAGSETEMIVAGGGARNGFLMKELAKALSPVKLMAMEELGVAAQAKEAVAFALLGWLSWHGTVGNVPAATGARRGVVLGKVTC